MSITNTSNRVSFTANSATTNFPFAPPFFTQADLVVLTVDAAGNTLTKVLNSDYVVTGSQDASGAYPNGGTVVFNVAPLTGLSIVIYRDPALTQLAAFVDNDPLPSATLNGALDKLTVLEQRSRDIVTRSLRQPDGDTTTINAIPPQAVRANGGLGSYAGYDAVGNSTTYVPGPAQASVSVAMAPVVTNATLAGARSALGVIGPADVPGTTADPTPDPVADLLVSYDTSASAAKAVRPIDLIGASLGFTLLNGDLVASVAGNALTIAIKTLAGNDPSASDPVYVVFRNATLATGTHTPLKITAATSLVISSGSVMGAANATPFRLWLVAFNDAGTFRLGAINCVSGTDIFPLRDGLQSSTAEGGAGAADSAQVIYTGTAVTSKPMRILGYMDWSAGLTTAGTWAIVPTTIQHAHHGLALPGTIIQTVSQETGAVATGTTVMANTDTIPTSSQGDQYLAKAITPTATMNVLDVDALIFGAISTVNTIIASLLQDSTVNALAAASVAPATSGAVAGIGIRHRLQAATIAATTFKVRAGDNSAGTFTLNGTGGSRLFGGVMFSRLAVTEVMA